VKTDDLIAALALDAAPVGPRGLDLRLVGAALAAAVLIGALVVVGIGVRPDLSSAMLGPTFWLKAGYTAVVAVAGGWLMSRLGRPGASVRGPLTGLLCVLAVAVVAGAANLMMAPPEMRMHTWLGHSWSFCARAITGLSLVAAPFIFFAGRSFAPTRPVLSGFVAGLTAGAIAATLYGLACNESTAAFVATWYSLGILAAGAVGAVVGRLLPRW
jgi:hypothetical protein